jgi:hypothetical protein
MRSVLGVGVPPPAPVGGWDLWLPIYIVVALVLLRFLARLRVTAWTACIAFAAGTAWAWAASEWGVVQAGGTAVLVAIAVGSLPRRARRSHPDAG